MLWRRYINFVMFNFLHQISVPLFSLTITLNLNFNHSKNYLINKINIAPNTFRIFDNLYLFRTIVQQRV